MADKSSTKHAHKHRSHSTKEGGKRLEVDLEWSDGDFCLFSSTHKSSEDISTLEDNLDIVCCSRVANGSSLTDDEKLKLTSLLQKLNIRFDTLQSGCGIVSSVTISSSVPVQFYTCLIDPHDTFKTGRHSDTNSSDSSLKYLLCCMSARKKGLELFREDLDSFTESLKDEYLKTTPDIVTPDSDIYKQIQSWTTILTYLSELIPKCYEQLPVLLHSSLNTTVKISGDDHKTIQQLQRFVDCCRVNALMETQPHVLQLIDIGPVSPPGSYVDINVTKDQKIVISSTETNEFTRKWSKTLLSQGVSGMDPFFLKKVMDDYKLKIIQDMNALKRLIREAETDYYSLYKCYTFLQSSGNTDLLLKCSLREAEGQEEKETVAVVKTLMEFITIKGSHSSSNNKPNSITTTAAAKVIPSIL